MSRGRVGPVSRKYARKWCKMSTDARVRIIKINDEYEKFDKVCDRRKKRRRNKEQLMEDIEKDWVDLDASNSWIGVDLDGTIAYHGINFDRLKIGKPIPAMVEIVKELIASGHTIKIFTARVGTGIEEEEIKKIKKLIFDWTLEHVGVGLDATATKDYYMLALYDDRAVCVEHNTGKILGRN